MTRARRSISGIRGTEKSLPPQKVGNYAKAFATLLRQVTPGNTVIVGMDTRPTSAEYTQCVINSLRAGGWDVIDLGIVPSPTVQIAISRFAAAGGVMITASHNPIEYNGIKFMQNRSGHGMFLTREQVIELFKIYDQGKFDSRRTGECRPIADFKGEFNDPPYTDEYLDRNRIYLPMNNSVILDYHLHRVIKAMQRDLDRIRGMNFRVAMDSCGGAGIPLNAVFLDYLYCRMDRINDRRGVFARSIEPAPRNLEPLCADLKKKEDDVDVCFVTDCDNDRCVLIARNPETGEYRPLEEDYTFALAVDQVLTHSPAGSTVVTNWSTSQMLDDIAASHHAHLRRAPTGEVNTATAAHHYHAVIAGEGSCAGVIDPAVGMGRDVLVAMWHTLAALARRQEELYTVCQSMPRYFKVNEDHKSNSTVAEMGTLLQKLQIHYAARDDVHFLNREDGLIVYFNDQSRIQVRSSNTEPILRMRSEALALDQAQALIKDAMTLIK